MPRTRPAGRGFVAVAERVEGFLLRLAVLGLLLLVVSQALLGNDSMRALLSYVDQLEGVVYDPATPVTGEAPGASFLSPGSIDVLTVSVALVNRPRAPGVLLRVNGVSAADFAEPHITLEVRPGDRLEIDGRALDELLVFRIVDASPALVMPQEGMELRVEGALVPLSEVRER